MLHRTDHVGPGPRCTAAELPQLQRQQPGVGLHRRRLVQHL
jgi:hypothetical protein